MLKKSAYILALVSLPFLLWMLFGFNSGRDRTVCKKIEVEIKSPTESKFLDAQYVIDRIQSNSVFGHLEGRRYNEFNIAELESYLIKDPFIADAEVYHEFNGTLGVEIKQKKALIRIEPYGDKGYYLDEAGNKFSLSPKFSPDVVIATGHIDTAMRTELYTLARFVHENPFWNAQIQQIFVGTDRSIIIIPTVGRHQVIFGSTHRLQEKFKYLETFYKQVLNMQGWQRYKEIDLRFENQIVCR